MNIQADEQSQAISDDQELAKALAGVNDDVASMELGQPQDNLGLGQPMETPPVEEPAANQFAAPMPDPIATSEPAPMTPPANNSVDQDLADVKQAALTELRPLVDKLDVDPEEKFNTYLLLVRSTDDKDLIAPAHEAAKAITDEAKKAQALLDIIKEIDFLSSPQQ